MSVISAEDTKRLIDALKTGAGDLKLVFNDGRSIKVHRVKLKLASLGGCLHNAVDIRQSLQRGGGLMREDCMMMTSPGSM